MTRLPACCLGLCLGLVMSTGACAQAVNSETGWLELVKGHLDLDSGTGVREVEPGDVEGERRITLAIPKAQLRVAAGELEEVRVIGRRPEPFDLDILPDFRYEWVADYDNEHYGLIIHLRDDGSVPLRLYMESSTGYIR